MKKIIFLEYARFFESNLDNNRLFCGDKLWLIFFVIRALLARCGLLVARSYKTGIYQDWRKDKVIATHLRSVLAAEIVDKAMTAEIGGISMALGQLEAAFLHEATRVMSGSKAMSDSLADLQSLMLLQNAQIAERAQA